MAPTAIPTATLVGQARPEAPIAEARRQVPTAHLPAAARQAIAAVAAVAPSVVPAPAAAVAVAPVLVAVALVDAVNI